MKSKLNMSWMPMAWQRNDDYCPNILSSVAIFAQQKKKLKSVPPSEAAPCWKGWSSGFLAQPQRSIWEPGTRKNELVVFWRLRATSLGNDYVKLLSVPSGSRQHLIAVSQLSVKALMRWENESQNYTITKNCKFYTLKYRSNVAKLASETGSIPICHNNPGFPHGNTCLDPSDPHGPNVVEHWPQ